LEDPAITYGIVFSNFMKGGVYTFSGGTDALIGKMKEELLRNGVDIKMQAKVEKITVEGKRATGVVLEGYRIGSRSVISNANLLSTVENLVGLEHFSPNYLQEFKKVRLNPSSCQVYFGLRKGESIPRMKDLIFYSQDEDFSTDLILSPEIRSQTFSIYYPDSRPMLENHYAIVSSSNARYQDWENLSVDEYQKRKEFLIRRAKEGLEKVIPGVLEKIDHVEAATPLTVERYTLHQRGSSFGSKFEGLPVSMNMNREVAGLFHSGSVGIIMSGWLGAANYGVIQAHEVENFLEKGDYGDI
jgi:phytoene dehydrogenase-like protein